MPFRPCTAIKWAWASSRAEIWAGTPVSADAAAAPNTGRDGSTAVPPVRTLICKGPAHGHKNVSANRQHRHDLKIQRQRAKQCPPRRKQDSVHNAFAYRLAAREHSGGAGPRFRRRSLLWREEHLWANSHAKQQLLCLCDYELRQAGKHVSQLKFTVFLHLQS